MKYERMIAMLTCIGLGASVIATAVAVEPAVANALSLTTTTTTTTTGLVTTLAPQDYCDICGESIPEGSGVRTPLGLFICSACKNAGAGGTTVNPSGSITTAVSTAVFGGPTTAATTQTTVAFTTNRFTDESGIVYYECYAYVGEYLALDDWLCDLSCTVTGADCTVKNGIVAVESEGSSVLYFYDAEGVLLCEYHIKALAPPTVTDETTAAPDDSTSHPVLVTTSPYYPEYNPWITDEAGESYYVGTNAYCETRLTMVSKPDRDTFALGEPLDLSGLKVFMTEYRNYNQRDYDVTPVLEIETDYDPNVAGYYTVRVYTDYTCGQAGTTESLEWIVQVSEDYIYTTVPEENTGVGTTTLPAAGTKITTTTTTTTTTRTTVTTTTTGDLRTQGDCNGDSFIKIDDVVLLCRYVAEDTTIETAAFLVDNADHNADGKVDANDAGSILQYLAGLKK